MRRRSRQFCHGTDTTAATRRRTLPSRPPFSSSRLHSPGSAASVRRIYQSGLEAHGAIVEVRGPMNSKHQGSCLCGEVRFEIEGEFERFYLCHCEYCRKDTGSAHAANLFSSTAALKWLSGAARVRQFDLPSSRHGKCFCDTCGSALPMRQKHGQMLVVPAGSLNSDVLIRPNAHILAASRANWDSGLQDIPMIEWLPR